MENDIIKVKAIIKEVIDANPRILKTPEAIIITVKIAEGAVNLSVRTYCSPEYVSTVVSDVNEALKLAFEKNNIKPAIPSRIIHNINI